ncbi:DUF4127 family protein [Anaeroarcus burkinensis]|uniref:DUF4127 family protein n=1 Tax=Anaeroarcus burkinensis TaxID=82376 RepID=UPI00041164FD|nr:DUF4127 family protein [Anaeroarcus burkinensis]
MRTLWKELRLWALALVLLPSLFITAPAAAATFLFVPIDDRPVCLQYTVETLQAAGHEVLTPPVDILSTRSRSGDADKLWEWVFAHGREADAVVLSADSLIYGGLVPSRTHEIAEDVLARRVAKFAEFKAANPNVPIYSFSTIMRTPKQSAGGTDASYYEKYGYQIYRLTALWDMKEVNGLTKTEEQEVQQLTAAIPQADLKDWMDRRGKNYRANTKMLEMANQEVFRYFMIGRDDSWPYCQSHKEARDMAPLTSKLSKARFAIFASADEAGMLLLTRAVNDLTFQIPRVYTFYSPGTGPRTVPAYQGNTMGELMDANIRVVGGYKTSSPERADLIVAVGMPFNGVTLEAAVPENTDTLRPEVKVFVDELAGYLDKGKRLALDDAAFSNGADNALMAEVAKRKLLPKLAAYAGWNTAGNSTGYAISQGILSASTSLPARERLISVRLLDDWAYQANVRQAVKREVVQPGGASSVDLGSLRLQIEAATTAGLKAFAAQHFPEYNIQGLRATHPWNRMFEVKIDFEK